MQKMQVYKTGVKLKPNLFKKTPFTECLNNMYVMVSTTSHI